MPQNIMHALCAVIRPDHFKFASYGPALASLAGEMAGICDTCMAISGEE